MKVDIEMTLEELNKVTELARPAQGNPVLELLPLLMLATMPKQGEASENKEGSKAADVGSHDNMQMTVEKFNEIMEAARAEQPLYESGKRALAISMIDYLNMLKHDDVSAGQAYEVIEMLDQFNLIDRKNATHFLNERAQKK